MRISPYVYNTGIDTDTAKCIFVSGILPDIFSVILLKKKEIAKSHMNESASFPKSSGA